jgi:hypothetical protein
MGADRDDDEPRVKLLGEIDVDRSVRVLGVGALLVAVGLWLAGCLEDRSDRPLGSSCSGDTECRQDLICRYGRCRAQCSFDRDCPDGTVCVVSEDPSERVCTVPDDHQAGSCPGETIWLEDEAVCRDPCGEEPDRCPPGYHCLETLHGRGVCVDEGTECLLYMAMCIDDFTLVHCVEGRLETVSCPGGCEVDMEAGGGWCL